MKKIAILMSFLLVFMCAFTPIEAKSRPHRSHRSSFSRSFKRSSSNKSSGINLNKSKKSTNSGDSTSSSKSSTNSKKSISDFFTNKNDYKIKKKASDSSKIYTPKYYKNYSSSRYYRGRSNMNFWKYYGLYHLFNDHDKVSEAEIVKNLEEQGYTEDEINQILEDAQLQENNGSHRRRYIIGGIALFGIIVIICVVLFRKFKR